MTAAFCNRKRHASVQGGYALLRFHFTNKHAHRLPTTPEYIMYTFPSGGWDNDEIDDKTLPADFAIDYVRAWQRKDLAVLPVLP